MRLATLIQALCARCKAFASGQNGNVAIIFAVSLVPLVGLLGLAVDYSRANRSRAAVQAALDSATLMLSKEAGSLDSSTLAKKANDYFFALLNQRNIYKATIDTPLYTTAGGSQLTLTVKATVKTDFNVLSKILNCANCDHFDINATSTVKWGQSRLRVALVLDNTGSMADDGKITALQTATKNLLSSLKNAATKPEDVYVSIIPFSRDVNIGNAGGANASATWVDWTAWDVLNGSCSKSKYTDKASCESAGKTWTHASHTTWNGCLSDRGKSVTPPTVPTPYPTSAAAGQQYDQTVTAPTGDNNTKFPADQYANCPSQLMGLTNDWTTMNTLVSNMFPNGNTNQGVGLVWGWMSLVGTTPLTAPAQDANYTYQQVIILLTDGLNTQNAFSSSQSAIDARMEDTKNNNAGTCKNIKNAGITLYTVQVNTGGDPTSQLLKDCASSSDKFFMLTSANEIVTTFNQIGTNLSKLRLAK